MIQRLVDINEMPEKLLVEYLCVYDVRLKENKGI